MTTTLITARGLHRLCPLRHRRRYPPGPDDPPGPRTGAAAAGRFREDLFYRLAVAVIRLPPLRERAGDIGRLLDQFNRESATEPGYEPKNLSVGARNLLLAYPWPGNVRELLNTLRRAAVWTPGPLIDTEDARAARLLGFTGPSGYR